MRGATAYPVERVDEYVFQSTRPMRGATRDTARYTVGVSVSIHAPHAGRDIVHRLSQYLYKSFNPRAPCGARLRICDLLVPMFLFQSTRPMRGAT